ncbi:hypothetical protein MLD38_016761 [Melastoma candidum]|uniref:Uncharacterized protein n=1 Tax=Melastoma candidum TaxID=119954 RepID=A0ACB9QNK9_9MYRT|nr:hypothetical protein MLD38_016761 [Melastoma candidum]
MIMADHPHLPGKHYHLLRHHPQKENMVSMSSGKVTQLDLHRHFYNLGAGVLEEVRVQRDKGFGFVSYSTHVEAALAVQMGNTQSFLRVDKLSAPGVASLPHWEFHRTPSHHP